MPLTFDGVLYFPVTPFTTDDRVDLEVLAEHVESRLTWAPGAVFPACGTGEFHALTAAETVDVVRTTVQVVNGTVPVVAGTGGSIGSATALAASAADSGADALLVLPPYLVSGSQAGLIEYVERIAAASPLPVIIYHRGTAVFTVESVRRLAGNPKVIGFKDGHGDLGLAQQIVLTVEAEGRHDFRFFNGLLTAELTQAAYRGIGVPLYSSAAFAMIPEVATAYYRADIDGDETTRTRLLADFYSPLVRLRDETPGFGVSLIKAGLRLAGIAVGSVRAPLTDPTPTQVERLAQILAAGRASIQS